MRIQAIQLAIAIFLAFGSPALGQTLYGADGAGGNLSMLYILDPTTGQVINSVGNVGFAVTGMAFHPLTGMLYGTTGNADPLHPGSLLVIDTVTGAGTLIGEVVLSDTLQEVAAGITFSSDGTLYGWLEPNTDALITIDLGTGAGTIVASGPGVGVDTFGSGLAFSPTGELFFAGTGDSPGLLAGYGFLHTLDPTTGAVIQAIPMVGGSGTLDVRFPALAFDAGGNLFGVRRLKPLGQPSESDLATIDTVTGQITVIGPTLDKLDALVFAPVPAKQAPVALCQDVIVSADADCLASAEVDDGSFDPDDDPITLEQSPPGPYSLGTTVVALIVTDDQGASDSCMATVTVEDTTLPDISVALAPSLLWPPNHRMVDVVALVSASDICSAPVLVLQSVTSSEPDDALGAGDGSTVDDIQGAAIENMDLEFQLRAERSGTGNGRTYLATYRAMDSSGNAATATALAIVPHNIDGMTEPLPILAYENGMGTVLQWLEVAGARFYNVVRGEMRNLRDVGAVFHLGPLTCIASATAQTNTLGAEDPILPPLGEAFFYLVEYNDGLASGYGTESAAKERFAARGQGSCP